MYWALALRQPPNVPHVLFIFAMLHGLWDFSSPTRDQTWGPGSEAPSPNHWTARELPHVCFLTRPHMDPMIAPIINSVFFTWILLLTQFYSKENWSSVREWLLPKCPMLADSSVCVCVCVSQLCPTLRNPMDCNLPGSSVHGILQARILEWVAMSFSRADSKAKF